MANTPPTWVATYGNAATTTTTPKTASVTTAIGDLLVVYAGTGGPTSTITAGPTGGTGLVWTSRSSVIGFTGFSNQYVWTAPAVTAETFTMSLARNGAGGGSWSFACLRFSAHGGVGASAGAHVATTAPTLNLTTTQDNSAVVVADADFTAASGTSRAWRTGSGALTETTYTTVGGAVTLYGGYHADTGAAGVETVGLSAPSQTYSIVAVEVLGLAAPAVTLAKGYRARNPARFRASLW